MPRARQAAGLKLAAASGRRARRAPHRAAEHDRSRPAASADPHTDGPSRFSLVTCDQAWAHLCSFKPIGTEVAGVGGSCGRVIARELRAAMDLPHFTRSYMDGYAVRARDTAGATAHGPVALRVTGSIETGQPARQRLGHGEAVRIPTGGMLPPGADAIVMVEHTSERGDGSVEITHQAAPGEHVMPRGEDVRRGQVLFGRGHRIRPRDVGALTGAGVSRLSVYCRPRIALMATGDEIVPPEVRPRPGQVRSINQYSLAAMIAAEGGSVLDLGVVPDRLTAIGRALARGLRVADMVVISGGSSVGTKDLTGKAVANLPGARVLVHGIRIKPGKPTLIARVGRKPVLGLPGHPVSALVIFELFGAALVRILGGEPASRARTARRQAWAELAAPIGSKAGREDYARVVLEDDAGRLLARPLSGGSADIYSLVHADGMVRVAADEEEIAAGKRVLVHLFS